MGLKLKTAPTTEPITLAQAKLHCRVDHNDEDTLFDALIVAARQHCEGVQNRAYITQTWELWLDNFPNKDYIEIPLPPLQSVTSVTYYDTNDDDDTFDDYDVDTNSFVGRIVLKYNKSWPYIILRPSNAVVIEFVAGYGNAAAVPQTVKQAMLLLISHWYANRETVLVGTVSRHIELAVDALLALEGVW